jgi:hypothetical protein
MERVHAADLVTNQPECIMKQCGKRVKARNIRRAISLNPGSPVGIPAGKLIQPAKSSGKLYGEGNAAERGFFGDERFRLSPVGQLPHGCKSKIGFVVKIRPAD